MSNIPQADMDIHLAKQLAAGGGYGLTGSLKSTRGITDAPVKAYSVTAGLEELTQIIGGLRNGLVRLREQLYPVLAPSNPSPDSTTPPSDPNLPPARAHIAMLMDQLTDLSLTVADLNDRICA